MLRICEEKYTGLVKQKTTSMSTLITILNHELMEIIVVSAMYAITLEPSTPLLVPFPRDPQFVGRDGMSKLKIRLRESGIHCEIAVVAIGVSEIR